MIKQIFFTCKILLTSIYRICLKKVTNDIYPNKLNITISTPLDIPPFLKRTLAPNLNFRVLLGYGQALHLNKIKNVWFRNLLHNARFTSSFSFQSGSYLKADDDLIR